MSEEKLGWEVVLRPGEHALPGEKDKIIATGFLKLPNRGEVNFKVILKPEEFSTLLEHVHKTMKEVVAQIAAKQARQKEVEE